MHTFTDWELRQLLEDTLEDAWYTYLENRAAHPRKDRAVAWMEARSQAIDTTMEARWMESTRPATLHPEER
jgi:5-methylthioribose kinase